MQNVKLMADFHISNVDDLKRAIGKQPEMMADLEAVAALGLPQGCIAAGYFRNFVWDVLHGYTVRTPLHDVDVLYYDPDFLEEEAEKEYDARLREINSSLNWSVKNQARMHLKNGEPPYRSVEDAMLHWPETATAIGARLKDGADGVNIDIVAPFGLDDLLGFQVRQSPFFQNRNVFMDRIRDKEWLRIWPSLQVVALRENEL
ncbi:nitrate reductase [Paenibacillus vini]|uniref:Nitrate reductase n=2 Tax=Paenibacillus vini TaxID=1476024 RepID=A0ABQ4M8U9_9BACL|nr:nitrate reductase [Paenibacillus vini]